MNGSDEEVCESCGSERRATIASYNTVLTVHAKDSTMRDVAVCAGDSAEAIGANVIAAINGERLFQLTTLKCTHCGEYTTPSVLPRDTKDPR